MAYFDEFPHYRDYDKDLGWLIKSMKQVITDVEDQNAKIANTERIALELKAFVTNYFDNLDVQEEINNKIDQMVRNGTLLTILSDPVEDWTAEYLADWLDEHITPATTVVLDTSLTVAGAAADAKAVGDRIQQLKDTDDYITGNLIAGGYQTYNGLYIRPAQNNIGAQYDLSLIVIPINPSTKYRIWKDTATIMRACTTPDAVPTENARYTAAVYHTTASNAPLEITSGPSDAYMYIQLYASADAQALKNNAANITTLIVAEDLDGRLSSIETALNLINPDLIAAGYTLAEGLWIRTTNKTFGSQSDLDLVVVPIEPLTTYIVKKNTATIMRVATGQPTVPVAGDHYTNDAYHETASSDALEITSGGSDRYMYIQLYASSDAQALKSIDANISTLTVYKSGTTDTANKIMRYIPYQIGSINQVVRLGWQAGTAPEQSIPAYKDAYDNNQRIMLADVRFTSANNPVCWHDENLSRLVMHTDGTDLTTQEKEQLIADMTLQQLDQYDFGIYKGPEYAGTKIMRLTGFLKFCMQNNCIPFLEVKVPITTAYITQIARYLKFYHLQDRCIIMNYYYNSGTANVNDWMEALPNARYVVGGAGNNFGSALPTALAYKAAGAKEVILGFSVPENLVTSILQQIRDNDLSLWYSEIRNSAAMETFWQNYGEYYKYISSSYINIYDWIYDYDFD